LNVSSSGHRYSDVDLDDPNFERTPYDLSETASIRGVVDRAWTALGRIDVVVSNAGYGLMGAAEELTDEQVPHQVDTNLVGGESGDRANDPHRNFDRGPVTPVTLFGISRTEEERATALGTAPSRTVTTRVLHKTPLALTVCPMKIGARERPTRVTEVGPFNSCAACIISCRKAALASSTSVT
jgi:NAD(P)-dependent dehydrogenase (short-subunit alcohol dehydrogenase family)